MFDEIFDKSSSKKLLCALEKLRSRTQIGLATRLSCFLSGEKLGGGPDGKDVRKILMF